MIDELVHGYCILQVDTYLKAFGILAAVGKHIAINDDDSVILGWNNYNNSNF